MLWTSGKKWIGKDHAYAGSLRIDPAHKGMGENRWKEDWKGYIISPKRRRPYREPVISALLYREEKSSAAGRHTGAYHRQGDWGDTYQCGAGSGG